MDDYTDYDSMVNEEVAELQREYDEGHDHLERDNDELYEGDEVDENDEDFDELDGDYVEVDEDEDSFDEVNEDSAWRDYLKNDCWDHSEYDE